MQPSGKKEREGGVCDRSPVIIFWTCADLTQARKLSEQLVSQKLIACANIIPAVESIFLWEGKIEKAEEVKVVFKTLALHFSAILKEIQTLGSYQVPEVNMLVIEQGNEEYLRWLESSVKT